jgi:uncharacterized protein
MTISLYDACVPLYRQILIGVAGYLNKGLAHCKENKIDPEILVESQIFSDMKPLRFQVQQTVHHSLGAVNALKSGQFSPGGEGTPTDDYAALQALIAKTREAIQNVTPAEINAREGAEVIFAYGERKMPFTALGFVQSFSLPNFFFHATTGYGILRMKGVPLGKLDYMGTLTLKS